MLSQLEPSTRYMKFGPILLIFYFGIGGYFEFSKFELQLPTFLLNANVLLQISYLTSPVWAIDIIERNVVSMKGVHLLISKKKNIALYYENVNLSSDYSCVYLVDESYHEINLPDTFNSHQYKILSHDITAWREITPCNNIDKPLVVYRFSGNIMTSITTLHTK